MEKLTTYLDGASYRMHNKRITFKQENGVTMIRFKFADKEAYKPACSHKCHKGKVRETFLKLSNEAMDKLVFAYLQFKKDEKEL